MKRVPKLTQKTAQVKNSGSFPEIGTCGPAGLKFFPKGFRLQENGRSIGRINLHRFPRASQ
jgi:hypothetical protein